MPVNIGKLHPIISVYMPVYAFVSRLSSGTPYN